MKKIFFLSIASFLFFTFITGIKWKRFQAIIVDTVEGASDMLMEDDEENDKNMSIVNSFVIKK